MQYSDVDWNRIAGNEYAYCNRMRSSDYKRLFADVSFKALRWEAFVDPAALVRLHGGFVVDERFQAYSQEDLATIRLRTILSSKS